MKIFSKVIFLGILSLIVFFSFEYKTKIEFIPSECSGKATVNIDGDTKEIDLSQNQKWKIKRRDNIVNNISFHDFPFLPQHVG